MTNIGEQQEVIEIPEALGYISASCVPRTCELGIVNDVVAQAKHGEPIVNSCIHFVGPKGAGKSWLLHEVSEVLTSEHVACNLTTRIIDLSDTSSRESRVGQLESWLDTVPETDTPVVIIDNIGTLNLQERKFLAQRIVGGQAVRDDEDNFRGSRAIFITSGTDNSPWGTDFTARRMLNIHRLEPLSLKQTAEQLRLGSDDGEENPEFVELIHFLSGGHPRANHVIAQMLSDLGVGDVADIEGHKEAIVATLTALIEEIVGGGVFKQVVLEAFATPRDLTPTATPVGVILEKETGLDPREPHLIAGLYKLRRRAAANWDYERGAYTMYPPLRALVLGRMNFDSPERTQKMNTKAARYFERVLSRDHGGGASIAVSYYYHTLESAALCDTVTVSKRMVYHKQTSIIYDACEVLQFYFRDYLVDVDAFERERRDPRIQKLEKLLGIKHPLSTDVFWYRRLADIGT